MMKRRQFSTTTCMRVLGLLILGVAVSLAGWKASGVLAQGGGGSEPGARTVQDDPGPGDKLALTTLPANEASFASSEPGASTIQLGETSPGMRVPASPPSAGTYHGPSEEGVGIPSLPDSPAGPGSPWPTHWYTVAGATFLPSSSGMTYQYGYNGCVHPTSNGYWRASVNLPDQSVLKYLYINYCNDDLTSLHTTGWVTKYKYDGTPTDLAWVNSRAGSVTGAGFYFDLSTEFTEAVDNLAYAYVFIWSGQGIAGTPQYLCSLQVGYYPPSIFGLALPTVLKNNP
jgi:hypothetical protein